MPSTAVRRRLLASIPVTLTALVATTMAQPARAAPTPHAESAAVTKAAHAATTFQLETPQERRKRLAHRRLLFIRAAVRVARAQVGDPYQYGAAGPNSFDCSGLLMYSYGKVGFHIPRVAGDQYRYARPIHRSHLRRGDLVFFHSGSYIYHDAIFLGRWDGRSWILHAPHTGSVVHREPIWTSSYYAATLRRR